MKLWPWFLAYVALSLPVVAHWYAKKARCLTAYIRLLLSRLMARHRAALARFLQRLLSEQSETEAGESLPTIPRTPPP